MWKPWNKDKESDKAGERSLKDQKKPAFSPAMVKGDALPSAAPPKGQTPSKASGVPTPQAIPGIKKIIAVGSGKGGVGKSTVSALLACAFADMGLRTALLDADVYGPSQVQLFGTDEKPKAVPGPTPKTPKMMPVKVGDISLMSFAFFVNVEDPVVWRGPMIMTVLRQFLFDVQWGEQDVLIVDLPPGTGDAPLSMVQCVPVDGVVIVTTPQALSVIDAIKGGAMFRKLNTPVLGVVENMSTFECDCGKSHNIFRKGGGELLGDKIQSQVLSAIPLIPEVCALMDEGKTWEAYKHPRIQSVFKDLASRIRDLIQ